MSLRGFDEYLEIPYVQRGYVEDAFNRWYEGHKESLEIEYMEKEGILHHRDMNHEDQSKLEQFAFDKWAYFQFER